MLNKLKELRESREEGFTLIELLVVIVIIGVLAAIALPIFLNQQKAAIAAGVKSDVKGVQTAVATYLVKKPTATEAELNTQEAMATPVQSDINKALKNVSDEKTVITVTGGWNNYVILGVNSNSGTSYEYNSTTGKYTNADYTAPAAPVTP